MSEDERLTDTIPAFRVNNEVSQVVRKVVRDDRRSISDVARALLERGVAAYRRDGQLFEPAGAAEEAGAEEPPAELPVPTRAFGKKEDVKKTNSA